MPGDRMARINRAPIRRPGRAGQGAMRVALLLLVGSFAGPVAQLRAEVTIDDPGTFVVDRAQVIAASQERQLEGWLRELEQKTGAQVKILTVQTTDGEDFFGFVHRHAERWKLGRKGKDNGVLIAVAIKDRKDRIHVGYGLEGVLPDAWCGQVRRQILVPAFKKGRFGDGLLRATTAIAGRIASQAGVKLQGMPTVQTGRGRGGPQPQVFCCSGFMPFIILWIVLSSLGRRARHYRTWGGRSSGRGLFWGLMLGSMLTGPRRGGGFGGGGFGSGFGGGGFGGGSFGGGGGFGGGGAGGSW